MPTPLPFRTPKPDAVARWLSGESPPEEAAAVRAWVDADPRRQETVYGLKTLNAETSGDSARVEALWGRVEEKIATRANGAPWNTSTPDVRPGTRRGVRTWTTAWRSAGLVAALAGIVFVWRGADRFGHRATAAESPTATRTLRTGATQRATVTLDDGTQIMLNTRTQLRVSRNFRAGRFVALDEGEVQFSVAHHDGTPFVIQMPGVRVTVLGTTFTVRRDSASGGVRVVVRDGRIAMRVSRDGTSGEAILDARTMGAIADSGAPLVVTPAADVDQLMDWTRGRIVLHDAPLRDALSVLEQRYGFTIHLADTTFAAKRVTADVSDAQPDEILDLIATAVELKYARDGNTVTFFRAVRPAPRTRKVPITEHTGNDYGK